LFNFKRSQLSLELLFSHKLELADWNKTKLKLKFKLAVNFQIVEGLSELLTLLIETSFVYYKISNLLPFDLDLKNKYLNEILGVLGFWGFGVLGVSLKFQFVRFILVQDFLGFYLFAFV